MFDKKAYIKQWRIDNRGKMLEQMKQYHNKHKEKIAEYQKKYMKEYRNTHQKERVEYDKRYWETHHKEILERIKQYNVNNLGKIKAQITARRVYPVSQICSVVGCNEISERHHPNYDKPLEIIWLCRKHHKELPKIKNKKIKGGILR